MLRLEIKRFYQVKEGQTLEKIAKTYNISPRLLVKINGLTRAPYAGQILLIPDERGNAYTVHAGESKALLCGSEESFAKKNGTDIVYPGMRIIL